MCSSDLCWAHMVDDVAEERRVVLENLVCDARLQVTKKRLALMQHSRRAMSDNRGLEDEHSSRATYGF